jgi:hypothetical protein
MAFDSSGEDLDGVGRSMTGVEEGGPKLTAPRGPPRPKKLDAQDHGWMGVLAEASQHGHEYDS